MKPPVKDEVTIPWISPREIPAVKLMLSAWRKLRRDPEERKAKVEHVEALIRYGSDLKTMVCEAAVLSANFMEEITLLHEYFKEKEKNNGK